jgi:serine/threonine-protein kinase RsbW
MVGRDSTWRLETSLVSRLGAHLAVIGEVASALASYGWCEGEVFGVQLALEECFTNAVRHGNREDGSKSVHVQCEISRWRFWAEIRDEGPGFRPDEVPDPTEEENLTAVGGRGLLLIKAYMTEVSYNADGNCVTLLKLRQSDTGREACREHC